MMVKSGFLSKVLTYARSVGGTFDILAGPDHVFEKLVSSLRVLLFVSALLAAATTDVALDGPAR